MLLFCTLTATLEFRTVECSGNKTSKKGKMHNDKIGR